MIPALTATFCLRKTLMKVVVFMVLLVSYPAAVSAAENNASLCGVWGIDAWGLSWHPERLADSTYNDTNWGLGVRCYARPKWGFLGKSEDNRVFLEADALDNSYRGLVLPISAGVEYRLASLPGHFQLSFLVALTVAYYQIPVKNEAQVRWGPVPSFAVGRGRFKTNITLIPSTTRVLAAVVASVTVVF
jgi:hypothetical protein